MGKKIGLGLLIALIAFLGFVSTRDGRFHYERSGVIPAPAEMIYPFLSDFRKGRLWSPYEKKDPQMKRTYRGPDAEVGSIMEFEGNSEAGSGSLEIVKLVPNQLAEIKLIMTKPIHAENLIRYQLTPEATGTRFTWSMEGDGGFLGKLVGVFMDCEKMIAPDLEKGIVNLRSIVETQPSVR